MKQNKYFNIVCRWRYTVNVSQTLRINISVTPCNNITVLMYHTLSGVELIRTTLNFEHLREKTRVPIKINFSKIMFILWSYNNTCDYFFFFLLFPIFSIFSATIILLTIFILSTYTIQSTSVKFYTRYTMILFIQGFKIKIFFMKIIKSSLLHS